jgi:hypothetical protein
MSSGICTSSAFRALVVALPILAGGCVPDDALTPKVPSTLDAALAEVAHPALDYASGWFSGAGVVTPAIVPTRCPFESASQTFVCSPLTAGGLTLTQRFTLLDATGGKQTAFDATATTGLHLENAVAGTWAPDGDTTRVDGQQALDLTGLGSSRHTLNGASLTLTTLVDPGSPASPIETERKTTITDLVLPVRPADAPIGWPLSGTVDVRSRSVDANGNVAVTIIAMRFDGSSIVTLTHTVPGGIETCRVNIATQGVGCPRGGPAIPVGADALPRALPTLR